MSYFSASLNHPQWIGDVPSEWNVDWMKWNVRLSTERPSEEQQARLPYLSNEDIESWTGTLLAEELKPSSADLTPSPHPSAMEPPPHPLSDLSKRERQVYEVIARLGRATARDVEREMPDAPTYSAVRSILRILTEKGHLLKARADDRRDWYSPAVPVRQVKRSAIREFVRGFFADSAADAACALLGQKNVKLSKAEADRLMELIREASQR